MRALVRQFLINDPTLVSLIPAERWYSGRSVVDTPEAPFAVLRFGAVLPGMAAVKRVHLEIWVHEQPGSYDTIDAVILRIRDIFDGVTSLSDVFSNISQATWSGDSSDLYDPGYSTNTKSTGYDLVGKGV